MTNEQLLQFKSNYVEHIVEDMDIKTMEAMLYDLLMDAYDSCEEDDIKAEILDLYDEETLEGLIP